MCLLCNSHLHWLTIINRCLKWWWVLFLFVILNVYFKLSNRLIDTHWGCISHRFIWRCSWLKTSMNLILFRQIYILKSWNKLILIFNLINKIHLSIFSVSTIKFLVYSLIILNIGDWSRDLEFLFLMISIRDLLLLNQRFCYNLI